MAAADWTDFSSLSSGDVARGVTSGIARPNGGGSFVFAMNSIDSSPGVVALYTNQAGFAPMAKGTRITGCVQRGPSGAPTGFSPFLFVSLVAAGVADVAYMLGLGDEDPHRIRLVKGPLNGGIPSVAVASPPVSGMLAASTATFAAGTWLQLRLDVILNGNGDVVINCYQSDLTANPCSAPVWGAIDGIDQFIDDALGINSGSAPLTGGYAGFGCNFLNITRRAFFDEITIAAQE